jgi:2-polyprenyl-3-methyl-5-hydroxy-6-metoxy-1,4-benzoquinol methylase
MAEARQTGLEDHYSNKSEGYYAGDRPEMLSYIPADARSVLDVGCGEGLFGRAIKQARPGCEVWGVEPTAMAERAARVLDKAVQGYFEADMPELAGRTFDCISFNDVLEHLVDPESALRNARGYLSPNGCVIASIPNILYFYQMLEIVREQDWKYVDSGILDNTHLRFFTRKSIVRLFETAGYTIDVLDGINANYGKKYKVMNALLLGHLKDWKYIQFAIRARPADR